MNIKELQLNMNEHKQLFIGWFWQQVLKREQVSNPLLTRSYFGNQVTERTKFSPAKQ